MGEKPKEVPFYVRVLKDEYVSIDDVTGASGLTEQRVSELQHEAVARCIYELEKWRDYWEPICMQIRGTEPASIPLAIFCILQATREDAGDDWPIVDVK